MVNYIEYVVTKPQDGSYQIEKKKFYDLLGKISHKLNTSGSQKHYTRYIFEDMHYDASNTESKTYRLFPKELEAEDCSCISKASYVKEKIPFYMFPSTLRIYENFDLTAVVFRIHRNIFINFETHTFTNNGQVIHKIYINHNVDERDDTLTINKKITDSLALLQSAPTF